VTSCFSLCPYSALQVRAFDYRQDSFDRPRRALGRVAQRHHPEALSQLDPPILDNNSAGYWGYEGAPYSLFWLCLCY
jgi:hypothetical protein